MGKLHLPVTAGTRASGCAKPKELLAPRAVRVLGDGLYGSTGKPCSLFSESGVRVFCVMILALIPLTLVLPWVAFSTLVFLPEVPPEMVLQAPPRSGYGCTCPSCIGLSVWHPWRFHKEMFLFL